MLTFVKILWSLATYPRRKRLELKKQKREGYEVEIPKGSRFEYVVYREGDKWMDAQIDISRRDEARLYTQTLREWQGSLKGQRLTQNEYELVVKRISEYLSLEGKVTLDEHPSLSNAEQLALMKDMAESEGWEMIDENGQVKFVRKSSKDAREA